MLKNIWLWIKKNKIWSVLIVIVVIIIIYSLLGSNNQGVLETAKAEISNVQEEVSVTGNVKPLSDVDLAFERGGKVASLPVEVGDKVYAGQVLATLSNSDLLANLNQAKANLKKAEAVLGNSGDKAVLGLSQAEVSLTNSITDSYTKGDDALRNKIYSLFDDPQRYNARLFFVVDSNLQDDIEKGRNDLSDSLDLWSKNLSKWDGKSDYNSQYIYAKNELNKLKKLLDDCSLAVGTLTTDSGLVSQTQIDTWKTNVSVARTNINSMIDSLTSAWSVYDSAVLTLAISKGDTLAEQASIDQARAEVASAEAELSKTIIRSPINGVITDLPVRLGEIVPANQTAVKVISFGEYQIEAFVPEADIAKIKIGNRSLITLDAYGPELKFDAKIIKIDPAATITDGVPTYKVTLKFGNQDERVRAGMTANLEIITAEKLGVIVVPTRAILSKSSERYVKILSSNNQVAERIIEVGLRGYDGKTEIVSGLEVGEIVVTK